MRAFASATSFSPNNHLVELTWLFQFCMWENRLREVESTCSKSHRHEIFKSLFVHSSSDSKAHVLCINNEMFTTWMKFDLQSLVLMVLFLSFSIAHISSIYINIYHLLNPKYESCITLCVLHVLIYSIFSTVLECS